MIVNVDDLNLSSKERHILNIYFENVDSGGDLINFSDFINSSFDFVPFYFFVKGSHLPSSTIRSVLNSLVNKNILDIKSSNTKSSLDMFYLTDYAKSQIKEPLERDIFNYFYRMKFNGLLEIGVSKDKASDIANSFASQHLEKKSVLI